MALIQELRDLGIEGILPVESLWVESSLLIYRFYPLIPQFGTDRHR